MRRFGLVASVLVASDSLCLLPTVVNGVALGGVTLTLVVVTAQK